jgi:hypothetical protein
MQGKIRVSRFEALQLGFYYGWFLASVPGTLVLIAARLLNHNIPWMMPIYCGMSALIARTGYNLLLAHVIKRHVENRRKLFYTL